MQIGVRAVIVAGWAVGDMAAAVVRRGPVRRAARRAGAGRRGARGPVASARRAAHEPDLGCLPVLRRPGLPPRHRDSNLTRPAPSSLTVSELRRRIRATTGLVSDRTSSLSALRRDIEEVRLLADEAAGDERDLVEELHLLEQDKLYTKASPAVRADIDADLASAWTQLGEFEIAVERFRSAIGGGGKDVPLVAVEQLVNLCVRLARETSDPASQRELIGEAVRALGALDALGPTAERKALWGSFYKKRACMTDPPDLSDMVSAGRVLPQSARARRRATRPVPRAERSAAHCCGPPRRSRPRADRGGGGRGQRRDTG